MRTMFKLVLAMALIVIMSGVVGSSTVLANPPTSGTPTTLSSLGTIVVGNTFTTTGSYTFIDIFSTAGPIYVERVLLTLAGVFPLADNINLDWVGYDLVSGNQEGFVGTPTSCAVVIPHTGTTGELISASPNKIVDPAGAEAIPAATSVGFELVYNNNCHTAPTFIPSGTGFDFEATVLAPATATVSICASSSPILTSCLPS